jgi:hypothetical protein
MPKQSPPPRHQPLAEHVLLMKTYNNASMTLADNLPHLSMTIALGGRR